MTPQESKILNRAISRAKGGIYKPFTIQDQPYRLILSMDCTTWWLLSENQPSHRLDELTVEYVYESICRLVLFRIHDS